MGKPLVAPRPPPSAAAFVGDHATLYSRPAGERASVPAAQPASGSGRRTVRRADGRELRKQTVYLPAELARRLAVHCAAQGLELSAVVAEALEAHLAKAEG